MKFRLKTKQEIDKLTFEERTRYFHALMKEMKPRETQFDEVDPGLVKRGREKKKPEKRNDSQTP